LAASKRKQPELAPYGGGKNAVRKDSIGENRRSLYQQIHAKQHYLSTQTSFLNIWIRVISICLGFRV